MVFIFNILGNVSEEQLDQWCKEIDEEEKRKEQEALAHAQWLKERECRKQEIERAWRPMVRGSPTTMGQKQKVPETLDSLMDIEAADDNQQQVAETAKPALSPLLTSLLKSPSQVSNISTSSILHSAITNQRVVNTTTNPTIASLLNSSPGVTVSPGLQHLVSNAIGGQEAASNVISNSMDCVPDLLEEAVDSLPNLKMEDLEGTILSSDEPLPEIKNDEVEVIISDLIENADDIVNDPEQHLKLDGNIDLLTNLDNELKELGEEDIEVEESEESKPPPPLQQPVVEKEMPKVDPFEFEEDPEIYPPTKSIISLNKQQEPAKLEQQQQLSNVMLNIEKERSPSKSLAVLHEKEIKREPLEEQRLKEKQEIVPGSVEIVEVVVMEDDEIEKQLNKSQIEDIVHSNKPTLLSSHRPEEVNPEVHIKEEPESLVSKLDSDAVFSGESSEDKEIKAELKDASSIDIDISEDSRRNTFTPEYSEEYYENLNMAVTKLDKSGKAKRDYSRTKKKEEKDFDILLAVEKAVSAQLEESDLTEDTFSDKEFRDSEKKFSSNISKIKSENERSNSPWTEEDEMLNTRSKRRYSTPATPIDSVPNSPASSIAYNEDDRDYRNWKKSVMLIYGRLATHKYASLFLKPITDDQAPGYHSIIYRPMDLQTIRKNIENGVIRTTTEFQRDVLLMFNNAIMYNKTNGHVYNMARQMQMESIQQIQLFVQAQSQIDGPARRETRTSEPSSKRKRTSEDASRAKKRKED